MENNNELQNSATGLLSFDPIVLVLDVAKRWLLVVLAALMVGVGSYIRADSSYTPVYKTTTTFVVTTRSSVSTVYSNLSSTSSLASVFSELLNSSIMRKAILEEIGAESFNGSISASVVSETNLINMTVTASDPRTAFTVAQAIIDHHEAVTYQIVSGISLEVLQSPTVPVAPSNASNAMYQMKRMMMLAALGSIALLAVLSYCRDTVRSGKEARKKLDCSYLGEIPHENKYKTLASRLRRRKSGILITSPITSFRYVETMRKLRRRVEQRMRGGKVLMVTSLLENEGKSTVATNLALAAARKHSKVLLIDCDLRKPACHTLLEQRDFQAGLRDVLHGQASAADALTRYKDTNLYTLLSRHSDPNSGELIGSASMSALLDWARAEFDLVVLDLPPMAEVSDAETMTALADASLLVVRQNTAATPALNKAIASLSGGKAKLLGCILNNVYSTRLSSGHNYGSYSGYGKYGHYGHYGAYGSNSQK